MKLLADEVGRKVAGLVPGLGRHLAKIETTTSMCNVLVPLFQPSTNPLVCVFTKASRQARQSCFRERSEYRGCGGGA